MKEKVHNGLTEHQYIGFSGGMASCVNLQMGHSWINQTEQYSGSITNLTSWLFQHHVKHNIYMYICYILYWIYTHYIYNA